MEIRIYSNTGELRLAAAPSQSDRETAGIGQDSVLSLSLTAFECVALEVYDYVDFLGRRYILTDAYLPKMVARGEWKYDLKLYGVEAMAAHTLMVNPTDGDDNPEVTLTAPAAEHAALIVANLNRRTGTTLWQVGTVIDTPYIDLDYTGMTASDAIAALASAADSEWWFDGYTFNLCRCEYGDAIQLEYGGMLLSEITPGIADGATFFTRLFPLGSTRNIDPDKYGHARLQLPDGSRYVDSRTDLGIIEAFEEDAFAGIYPRRVGKVGEVRSEQRTGEDGVDYTVWYFTDPDLPFNPNDYEIGGLVKKVTFQSGELRGRVFEVNYDTAGKEFEIITQWPYENDVQLPTPPLIPATGDEYVLWNISMPESYYPAAEEEYRQAVDEFIADKQREVTQFSAPTDCTVVGSAAAELRPGRRVRIVSAEYFPETGYRETRIISVSRSVENPASMTLTMGDVLSSGRLQRIENGLSEISGATSRIETNLSSSSQSLQRKLDRSVFYDFFEKVSIGTDSDPKYAIRAKYSFYTDGFLSALGLNPNTGGGGGGGATALSELSDVQLSGLLTGDVLIYDGTHWVNRPQSSIVPDLSEYATRTWVQQQGYATSAALAAHAGDTSLHVTSSERTLWNRTAADFAAIVGADSDQIINKWEEVVAFLDTYTEADTLANLLSNKVDKVTGYGLSKNDFTDALLSKLNGIEAGANRYIHPTGGADAAIDDAAGRVLAGITVNALGHVTSVSSKTLAAADIPTLSISKVSGLQDALDGKLDKAEFYRYFEEVNIGTAEAPVYATRSKRGLFSDSFLSSLGLNSSGGGGTGGASYDRLDLWGDYTSERAGWVLSAALGYDLYSRVRSLEGGSALSFTTEGTGNVVTAVKKSGTAVVVTKGLTALTSHQPIYSLNFQAGAFEAKTYTPNTGAQTVNIPTKTSHLSNDSGFITASALTGYATQSWVQGLGYITSTTAAATFATKLGVSGNQIGTYVNGKLGNLITVPYAANADKWDGEQLSSFRLRKKYAVDLTSLSSSNFYPVVFSPSNTELDCEIHSPSVLGSAAYNQNHIHYLLTSQGWSDTPHRFVILSQGNYDDNEITIGAVGYGMREGMTCVWLRGGRSYDFVSNRIPTLETADYTYGDEVYTVGTALSGGANQNVTVVWQNDGSRTDSVVALQGGTIASALNAANAANADKLDSYHEISFFRDGRETIQEADLDTFASRSSGTYRIALSGYSDSMAVFKSPLASASALELRFSYKGVLWARFSADANRYTTDWKQIAFTDSNVASATKLQTARTLWGQSFNGESNVSGDMTGVGSISASGYITVEKSGSNPVKIIAKNGNGTISIDTTNNRGLYDDSTTRWLIGTNGVYTFLMGGSVGIGNSNPAYKLDVTGVVHATAGIFSDGYMSAKGINTASDVRLKRRIADVALTVKDVAEAPVYRFAWINGGGIDVGSTAQYWAARVPELTHLLADGIHLGLDYGKAAVVGLVPVAKATLANTLDIAEHGRQLKELDSRIASLERQLLTQNAI